MSGRPASTFRRTKRTAIVVGLVTLLTFLATDPGSATPNAPAQTAPFNAGRGNAIAIAYKVNPVFGNLSFGITAGESVAGHQNTAAQGQSKAVNLGVIGLTLAAEGCEGADPTLPAEQQPQPVVVGSNDPGAEQGQKETIGEVITQFARATKAPFTEVITTVAPLGAAGLVEVTGATATATSGVVAEGVREARAVTEIAKVRVLDGLIVLGDMRWEAIQRTGARTENIGTFSLGTLTIAGTPIPLPEDPLAQLEVLTDALREFVGLELTMPKIRVEEGVVFVDPLSVGVVPAQMRDDLLGLLLGDTGLLPDPLNFSGIRTLLTDLIISLGCGSDTDLIGNNHGTLITVLDLALGTVTGAGETTVELGGVQATTAEIQGFQGLGEFTPLAPLPPPPEPAPPITAIAAPTPPVAQVAAPPAPDPVVDTGPTGNTPTKPIAAFQGERGGILLGVAAAGILALLAAAEADRRKMRRAQRLAVTAGA